MQRIEDCTSSQEKYMYHFKSMWRQTEETADTEGDDEFAQLQRAAHVATFSREKMDQYVRDAA